MSRARCDRLPVVVCDGAGEPEGETMTADLPFWRAQRSIRVQTVGRPGFSVEAVDTEDPVHQGGFLFARGLFLMTHEAATILDLGEASGPDAGFPTRLNPDDYRVVDGDSSPLYSLGIREYEYLGELDLPQHVAELQCRARTRARARQHLPNPASGPRKRVHPEDCTVSLHYVVTGEGGWIPKGNPDSPPGPVPPVAALNWGSGDPEIAVVDTGLDIYSSATGENAQFDATEPTPPEGSVLLVDKDADVDLLYAELPDGSKTTTLASQAGHGTFITWIAERWSGEKTRIVNVRALDPDGVGTEKMLVGALTRLLTTYPGVAVINLSLGGYSDPTDYSALGPEYADASPPNTIPLGIGSWLAQNSDLHQQPLFVASAGNNGIADRPFWPAADSRVVGVGSVTPNRGKSMFSNSGSWVDAWSLGEDVIADYPAGDFEADQGVVVHMQGAARWSGTSFAAPLVGAEVVRRRHATAPGQAAQSPTTLWHDLRDELEAGGSAGPYDQGVVWDPRDLDPLHDPTRP
jgi:hypothetical protein